MKIKPKKCRLCKAEFMPLFSTTQVACSPKCAAGLAKQQQQEKEAKAKVIKKKEMMTKSDWIKSLQQVFNTFIRLRDRSQNCISCDTPLMGKYDAGHYYSCGAYPALRFNELNTHGQCVACNQHKHGNITEYAHRLPNRIGHSEFVELLTIRNIPKHYSIEELQELILLYKEKIKQLKK